jgi:ABC-type multidrug transport system fused ATPase/permease subunit
VSRLGIFTKYGLGLIVRDITFRYPNVASESSTVKRVSLSIPANSFVLLVGENGSGKTTLLKLIARLLEPTSGDIFVDNYPLTSYDLLTVRHHTTFLMQTEEIYPLSLRENLLLAVPNDKTDEDVQESVDEAIRLGGAERLIERVGYGTILNPPQILGQSLQGCGNGPIGQAAIHELEKHTLHNSVPISSGEKQRFLAYVASSFPDY